MRDVHAYGAIPWDSWRVRAERGRRDAQSAMSIGVDCSRLESEMVISDWHCDVQQMIGTLSNALAVTLFGIQNVLKKSSRVV